MIPRSAEHDVLERARHFPVVGIVGPRQVGKTTLAKSLLAKLPRPAEYLDMELPSDFAKLQEAQLYLQPRADRCIVIDEVQRVPQLFPLLRALVDQRREPARFLVLGSASPHLLRQSAESLAGRISYVELAPLNMGELPAATSIFEHWFYGGFPEPLLTDDCAFRIQWLDAFIRTYVERDLPMLGLRAASPLLRSMWSMLAHGNAQTLSLSDLSRSLGVSVPTVRSYVEFMEQAFLLFRLPPFAANLRKRLVKRPKIYLTDTGIYHRLLGLESLQDLQGHPHLGRSWENYAIAQIRNRIGSAADLFYYRTHDGAECDLVVGKGGTPRLAVEVKYTATPRLERGNTVAFADLGARANVVVTPSSDEYEIGRGVTACSLRRFLDRYLDL